MALHAAAAAADPPLSPVLLMTGRPLVRAASLAAAAPTKPTGRAMTAAGEKRPAAASASASHSAVGAQPMTTTAPAGWRSAARRMAAALRVPGPSAAASRR